MTEDIPLHKVVAVLLAFLGVGGMFIYFFPILSISLIILISIIFIWALHRMYYHGSIGEKLLIRFLLRAAKRKVGIA